MNKAKLKELLANDYEDADDLYDDMIIINREKENRFEDDKFYDVIHIQMYLYHVKKGIHTISEKESIPELIPKEASYDEFIAGLEKYRKIKYENELLPECKNLYARLIQLSNIKLLSSSYSWSKIYSSNITGNENINDGKIYISIDNKDLYYFAYLLLIKCLRDDILDYEFKTNFDPSLNRTDNLVIYFNKENVNKYLKIINEIKSNYPEFKFNYSQIPAYELSEGVAVAKDYNDGGTSFTGLISEILYQNKVEGKNPDAIVEALDKLVNKHLSDVLSMIDEKYKPKKPIKEEVKKEEVKHEPRTPYNAGLPKDISGLSKEEQLKEIKEFAEGSKELEDCLIASYENGLETNASCKGFHEYTLEDYQNFNFYALATCMIGPYISYNSNEVLDYLSLDFIQNPNIEINIDDNKVSIHFYGKDSYSLLNELTNNIRTGIKEDKEKGEVLANKFNKRPEPQIAYESYLYGFKENGMFDLGNKELEEFLKANAILNASMFTSDPFESARSLFDISGVSAETQKDLLRDITIRTKESSQDESEWKR